MSKLRRGFLALEPRAALKVNGVGAMEVAEIRGFVGVVVDGLRRLNASREDSQREAEGDDDPDALGGSSSYYQDDDDDDTMDM